MNKLIDSISLVSDAALPVMKAVLDANNKLGKFENDDKGPLVLASVLSDFFGVTSSLENGGNYPPVDKFSDFAEYGLDLLDRLAYFVRALEVMEHGDDVALIFASTGYWFAKNGATFSNLDGIADGFGQIVNGLKDTDELAYICKQMLEVAEASVEHHEGNDDTSDPWRPWRVLNLNAGIAATRSMQPDLMESTFEILSARLPSDMPIFFRDGFRMMQGQHVSEEAQAVMQKFASQTSIISFH